MIQFEQSLTAIESLGLVSEFNFADGHAYQDLSLAQDAIVDRLDEIWRRSCRTGVKEQEGLYQEAFWRLAESPSLAGYPHFRICPTASNSIDLVAAWLAHGGMRVGLIEPTFDNLYLLLKRRGVATVPFDEERFHSEGVTAFAGLEVDALFFVNPNNPSGRTLTEAQFRSVVEHCVRKGIVLLLDNTFRFFMPQAYDQYRILLDSGVRFIAIEDTGKVWPTQDMKASLMIYSKGELARVLDEIYEEIYLCVSKFSLAVLTEFLGDARARGLASAVWAGVAARRAELRLALTGTVLQPTAESRDSRLSVEWTRITSGFATDLELAAYFRERGVVLLPGRNFYWSGIRADRRDRLRFSLLKPAAQFSPAVAALRAGLREVTYAGAV